jgi:muconolactone delta-isomerase
MALAKFAKVTFFYRTNKEPTTLIILQSDFSKDIHRIISRIGVFKYKDIKVDLTIVNKIDIEFFEDEVII